MYVFSIQCIRRPQHNCLTDAQGRASVTRGREPKVIVADTIPGMEELESGREQVIESNAEAIAEVGCEKLGLAIPTVGRLRQQGIGL